MSHRTALALLVAPLFLFALAGAKSAHAQLSYVEASQGLEVPGFESGDSELELGDVNQDGHLDIVSVGDHGNPNINSAQEGVLVWLGDGRGAWSHRHFGKLGYGGIALGDVNGDGTMDVAYGIHHDYGDTDLGDQLLEVALGDGSGTFWTPWDDGLATNGETWGLFATDLADVDGDGDLDVGSMGFGASAGLQVYLNRGEGSWERSFGFIEGNSSHVFAFGDVNNDGHPDFATAKEEGTVWLNDGEGFFELADGNLPAPPLGWSRRGPSLGDVDNDGYDDLAFCSDEGHPRVFLWRGGAGGASGAAWVEATAPAANGDCQRSEIVDMDGDAHVDLVTFGKGQARVFAGDGAGGAWAPIASFSTGHSPGNASAFRAGGDVDHNGLPDMAILDDVREGGLFPDDINELSVYRESSLPAALSVRVVAPIAGRVLLAGSQRQIAWMTARPGGEPGTATIELSTSGPGGPWQPLVDGIVDDGQHPWRVPAIASESAHLRVRALAADGGSEASATSPAFTIAIREEPIDLRFDDHATLSWSDTLGRGIFHVYRGDLEMLIAGGHYTQDPASSELAARFCDLSSPSLSDAYRPPAGAMTHYLVSAVRTMDDRVDPEARMAESTLGRDSAAFTRRNAHPCPLP